MAIENFQCARHFSSICYRAHHGWAGRTNCPNESSRKAGKRYFEIGFCKCSILDKIATLLIFC